jgi:hypothetical protein
VQVEALKSEKPKTWFMDATHNTNTYGYPLYTIAYRDRWLETNALAWIITSSAGSEELELGLRSVLDRIGWDSAPNSYLIDDDASELRALLNTHGARFVFAISRTGFRR